MAQLSGTVVVHSTDQDHQFCEDLRPIRELLWLEQRLQPLGAFDKVGDVRGLQTEGVGIPFSDHLRFVLPQVTLREILAHQVFLLHFITIADDKFHRTIQSIEQTVKVGRDMRSGAAGSQHDDFDRPHF